MLDIEAILCNKPLIKTISNCDFPAEMLGELRVFKNNAAHVVSNVKNLEDKIYRCFSQPDEFRDNANKTIEELGITFDGNMCDRIIDNLLRLRPDKAIGHQ